MRAYSVDLRQRIVTARRSGQPTQQVAVQFGVSVRTVERYVRQEREQGTLAPRPLPGRTRHIRTHTQEAQLRQQLRLHPAATLAEHCARWEQTTGQRLSVATMARSIQRLGWTRKKGHWQPGSRTRRSGLPGGRRS